MSAKIAEVAIPISIALNEQFDYLIPDDLLSSVCVGSRVLVPFRSSRVIGYVIGLKKHSAFENKLRPVLKSLDSKPVLDSDLMELAYEIHDRYFCSLADALATVVPSGLKNFKKTLEEPEEVSKQDIPLLDLSKDDLSFINQKELKKTVVLIHDLSNKRRWDVYSALIKKTLNEKKSVIFLVPDHQKINSSLNQLNLNVAPYTISSNISRKESAKIQAAIKLADFSFVAGTRSAIFAPVRNLGLIILEEEDHFAYRQDQVPHYRCSGMAFFRAA